MHPLEHLVYLSGFLIHWIVPSHPIHVVYNLMDAVLTPANGHRRPEPTPRGAYGRLSRCP